VIETQVIKAVVRLAAPVIASQVLETLLFLVDRIMLGRYTAEALASMQISGPLIWSISSVLSAFAIGSVALVGRAVGSGDRTLASSAARASLLFALATGTTASVLSLLGLRGIFALFPGVSVNVQQAASGYLGIVLPAMPLLILSLVAAALLQAAGNTRTPFLVALFANVVNALINYCLIFGKYGAPALGVRGSAIGSTVAMAINATVLLVILFQRTGVLTLRGRGGEWAALRRILRVSTSAFGEQLVQHLGYFGFVAMIGALGSVAMAANQALISIESICFLSAEGFGIAAATVVAQHLGAGRPQTAATGAKVAVVMAIALLGLCALVFLLIPAQLLGAFSPDSKIVSAGIGCLYVAALAQPFMAVSIVLGQALRGAGDTRTAFFVSLAGWFLVRLVATYLFAFGLNLGLVGVWLGSTCDWIVRAIALVVVFFQGRWRQVSV
jgi:putative MATE family efflux protein